MWRIRSSPTSVTHSQVTVRNLLTTTLGRHHHMTQGQRSFHHHAHSSSFSLYTSTTTATSASLSSHASTTPSFSSLRSTPSLSLRRFTSLGRIEPLRVTAEEYYRLNPEAAKAAGISMDSNGNIVTPKDETSMAAKLQAEARLRVRAKNRRQKVYRFVWKSVVFLLVVSSVGLYIITEKIQPAHPWHKHVYDIRTFSAALVRLWRDIICVITMVTDYWWVMRTTEEGPLRAFRIKQAHQRNARRLYNLMKKNGGVYIKFGQHVSQLQYLLPIEYVKMMQPFMNSAPLSSKEDVQKIFLEEFNCLPEDIFETFDYTPVASASLAQVHKATLKKHKDELYLHTPSISTSQHHVQEHKSSQTHKQHETQTIAVKVQHRHVQANSDADIATVKFLVETVHRIFPQFDYNWLAKEMAENLPLECNFRYEAANAERCAENFAHRLDVVVPKIVWSLTTPRILSMEWMDGCHMNDHKKLKEMKLNSADVSNLIGEVFNEMVFKHGFVHCDPHVGNLLVQKWGNSNLPRLVLLDHGLYREIPDALRLSYSGLWFSIIKGDNEGMKKYSAEMNAGELFELFASMLTMKPYDQIVDQSSDIDRLKWDDSQEARAQLQDWAVEYSDGVQKILAVIPRPVLLLLKTNDCLRTVDSMLGTPINSFTITARYATQALVEHSLQNGGFKTYLKGMLQLYSMEARILAVRSVMYISDSIRAFLRAIRGTTKKMFFSNRSAERYYGVPQEVLELEIEEDMEEESV